MKIPLLLLTAAAMLLAGCVREQVARPDDSSGLIFTLTAPQTFTVPDYTVVSTGSAAAFGPSEEEVEDEEEDNDEGAEIFVSTDVPETPPPPVNLGGDGAVTITRQDTGERLRVAYRNPDGSYSQDAMDKIDHIMRCSYDGSETQMAIKLIELLDAVEDHFGKKGIILLSGYRTREYNEIVPGSAKHSLHMLGWAADIKIPGLSSTKIKNFGLAMGVGGVGYYPNKGFTHLDVGSPRYWVVRRVVRRRRSPSRRLKYQTGTRVAVGTKRVPARSARSARPAPAKAKAVKRSTSAKKKNKRA